MTEAEIIQGCKRGNRRSQKLLYERFAARMFGVCKRYVRNHADAEELLVAGMFKAITKIGTYNGSGSLEGWIRRIIANECLMFLRKRHDFSDVVELEERHLQAEPEIEAQLAAREMIELLDALPVGYRTVFNLYVIEGYKHREIAAQLGISIHTSKSQLILAKKKMRDLITERKYNEVS